MKNAKGYLEPENKVANARVNLNFSQTPQEPCFFRLKTEKNMVPVVFSYNSLCVYPEYNLSPFQITAISD